MLGLGLRDDLLVSLVSFLQRHLRYWIQEQVQEGGERGGGEGQTLSLQTGETEEMSPPRLSAGRLPTAESVVSLGPLHRHLWELGTPDSTQRHHSLLQQGRSYGDREEGLLTSMLSYCRWSLQRLVSIKSISDSWIHYMLSKDGPGVWSVTSEFVIFI